MQINLFRSIAAYSAELPNRDAMLVHLAERPFVEVLESHLNSAGFVNNLTTGELVTPIEGGYSFTYRYDEKLMPSSSVNAAVAKAQEDHRTATGQEALSREERNLIKEKVVGDLVKVAMLKAPQYVNCFYHEATQRLIISSSSKSLCSHVMHDLIRCVGSVKTSTIWVHELKGGITTRLKNFAYGAEDAFGEFKLGDSVVIKGEKGAKATFDGGLSTSHAGITEALEQGMQVDSVRLEFGGLEFKLTSDFKLRSVGFTEQLTEAEIEERYADADSAYLWRIEGGLQLLLVVNAIGKLCEMFEYKAGGAEPKGSTVKNDDVDDGLYQSAVEIVVSTGNTTISNLQRKLKIGYNGAVRLIERMEEEGVLGPIQEDGKRQVMKAV